MQNEIVDTIARRLEKSLCGKTRLILVCETGSVAQGYATHASDHDVKCVYVRPEDDYLSVFKHRDNMELSVSKASVEMEVVAWDVTKFLSLARGTNPQTYEWLSTPVIHFENEAATTLLKDIVSKAWNPYKAARHYYGMSKKTYSQRTKGEQIPAKRYITLILNLTKLLYVLDTAAVPPFTKDELMSLDIVPQDVRNTINALILQRQLTQNRDTKTGRRENLDEYYEKSLEMFEKNIYKLPQPQPLSTEIFDEIFRQILKTSAR